MKRSSVSGGDSSRWAAMFQPRRLLGLCYALGVMLWLLYATIASALMLNHKMNGSMRSLTLTAQDLSYESFLDYDDDPWSTAPDEREDWYLSTDNDPHILWEGEA